MKLKFDDIKDNLDFCDGDRELTTEDILNFLEENIDKIDFSCINDNVPWELCKIKEYEELEDKACIEKHYMAEINVDDDGNLTLEDSDNSPVEVNYSTCKDRKLSWVQHFD